MSDQCDRKLTVTSDQGSKCLETLASYHPNTSLSQYRYTNPLSEAEGFYKWPCFDVTTCFIRYFQTIARRIKCRRLEDKPLITVLVPE
jgi:hypothetical protein